MVKGPGSVSRMIRPESLRAAIKVEKSGLKTRRSSREQPGAQLWGTAAASSGGLTGPGSPERLGRCRGCAGFLEWSTICYLGESIFGQD